MIIPKSLYERFRATASGAANGERGQLGVFMVLVLGAVALVVVSIVLLFGMQIAGSFADGVGDEFTTTETFDDQAAPLEYTVNNTGDDDTLDDTVTVFNETSDTELNASAGEYNWDPGTGTVEITDGSLDDGSTYNITYSGDESAYAGAAGETESSTGDAFELFGTSVLVIPAAAVLAVLIGGMVGAIAGGGGLPGMGSGRRRRDNERRR